MPEQFEPSPFMPKGMDDEDDAMFGGLQGTGDGTGSATTGEKEILKETNNVAKIKVVVCNNVFFTSSSPSLTRHIQLTGTDVGITTSTCGL